MTAVGGHHSPSNALFGVKPYFADDWVTIYHGDAREILPGLRGDAVVTDPPYGIGFPYDTYEDTPAAWFALMDEIVPVCRDVAPFVVMPSCRRSLLKWWYDHHPPDWMICWYKGSTGHRAQLGFADWEAILTWGKPPRRIHDFFQTRSGYDDGFAHTCPKPMEWARWLVGRAVLPGGVVVDLFAGSGTVLRAAKDLGRRAVGIEISERYCDVIAARCAQETLDVSAVEVVDAVPLWDE